MLTFVKWNMIEWSSCGVVTNWWTYRLWLWLSGRYSKLQQQYNEAFTSIQDQKQLIAQLEEDLRSVNAWSAMFRGTAEVRLSSPSWLLPCMLYIINTGAFHKSERKKTEFLGSFESAVHQGWSSSSDNVFVANKWQHWWQWYRCHNKTMG